MNELRWILLGIGIVLLALIYLFARRTGDDDDSLPSQDSRYEPALSSDSDYDDQPLDETLEDNVDSVLSPTGSSRFDAGDDHTATNQSSSSQYAQTPALGALDKDSGSVRPSEEVREQVSVQQESAAEGGKTEPSENAATPLVPEKVIALHLMPKAGQMFDGIEFIGAIQAEGLKFGKFDIFHRYANAEMASDSSPSQFSLANMIKPGTFNLRDLESQQFKGASMFLVLPGPEDAVAAFADMVATGRRLAATLEGQLLDAQGTALSRQSASHLREDIINYQHGLSAAPAE